MKLLGPTFILLIWSATSVAADFTVTSASGNPGETVQVTLAYDASLGDTPVAIQYELNFDPGSTGFFSKTSPDADCFSGATGNLNACVTSGTVITITSANIAIPPVPPLAGANPFGTIDFLIAPYAAPGTYNFTLAVTPIGCALPPVGETEGTCNATQPGSITVNVSPQPVYSSNPVPGSTINVGSALVNGGTTSTDLAISNPGSLPLTVTGGAIDPADSDFSVAPLTIDPIAAGGSQTVEITCAPSAVGERTATLSYTTNDTNQTAISYTLECTGTPQGPGYESSPASPGETISIFGAVVGDTRFVDLTVSNAGTVELQVTNGQITGSDAALFSAAPLDFNIAPSGNQTVSIGCSLIAAGEFNATLTFDTNDTNNAQVSYGLQCTTAEPPPEPPNTGPPPGPPVEPIPTLSEWAMLTMSLLLALIAFFNIRRRVTIV